jgi:cation:H+ antiporter
MLVGLFAVAAGFSLGASSVLVRSLERLAARAGLTEAMLGVVSAVAANSPELTSSIAALVQGQHDIGVGVVLGSNVFNLAALLGLGAVVAGAIRLHRTVVVFVGGVGAWVVAAALVVVAGGLPPVLGLVAVLLLLVPYLVISAAPRVAQRLPLPERWCALLRLAVVDEEIELAPVLRPPLGRRRDAVFAAGALVTVVVASVVMERSAGTAGSQLHLPAIVIGGLVLAAVTSLPNAVAAIYLAGRGRGAAVLSETMNSNTLNVVLGLLLPACFVGLPHPVSGGAIVAAGFACALTLCALVLAYLGRGLQRRSGSLLIAGYAAFVAATVVLR